MGCGRPPPAADFAGARRVSFAAALHPKLGFSIIAEIRDKPLGHTEILMRLSLREDVRD
jgi:hypothetical protein